MKENVSIQEYVSDVITQLKNVMFQHNLPNHTLVEFELSTVINSGKSSKTSAGLGVVSVLNLGAKGSSAKDINTQTTNRIKFSMKL